MKHKRTSKKGKGKRRMKGKGKIGDFFKKAGAWLKKTGAVSKVANVLGDVGVPYASTVGKAAQAIGYGRKRRMRGKGPYRFDKPPFAAGRGFRRSRLRGRGTPGMGQTDPTTYPIATSMALPRF